MADIAISAGNQALVKTVTVTEQLAGVAGAALTAGQPVYLNTSTGRFHPADASAAGTAGVVGVAPRSVASGEAITVICRGILDLGTALNSENYGAQIYLSDTDAGVIANTVGTVTVALGRVVPGFANSITTAERLFKVML